MGVEVITDAREYLFALFEVTTTEKAIELAGRRYLGTGFFVSSKGDAVTAAHVLPDPATLALNRRLVACLAIDGEQRFAWVTHGAVLEAFDVALFHVNLEQTKYFEISSEEVPPGTDISVIGYPSHQILGKGIEMRFLKGHVTAVMPRLELNFPVPAGMSGSPVFIGTKVVGFATGRVRSEEIDEQTEELITVTKSVEQLRIRTTASIIYYGLANSFWMLKDIQDPVLGGKTLIELIEDRNH
jgi:hypothetical protein